MVRVRVLLILLAVVAVGAAAWYGKAVPFAEQWPLFEALRTTASIIFAVIGAWLAIIYPERLKQSLRGQTGPRAPNSTPKGWTELLTPVFHSTAILVVILCFGVVAPLVKNNLPDIDIAVLRGASYGLLVFLTLWQVWTVIHTLRPADLIETSEAHRINRASLAASFGTPQKPDKPAE